MIKDQVREINRKKDRLGIVQVSLDKIKSLLLGKQQAEPLDSKDPKLSVLQGNISSTATFPQFYIYAGSTPHNSTTI